MAELHVPGRNVSLRECQGRGTFGWLAFEEDRAVVVVRASGIGHNAHGLRSVDQHEQRYADCQAFECNH